MKFWNFIKNKATETEPETIELRIDGEIVDDDLVWLYEWCGIACASPNVFRNELKEYEGKDITVWIDSYGGSVFAGAGIYNALKRHKGKITTNIDGKAMSAASVIFMAGDVRNISPVGVFMMHNPITGVRGYARDLRKAADVLDVIKETIINAYRVSGKSHDEIWTMMEDETYMSANVAVKNGFADGILFNELPLEVENIKDFAFNRLAISNSINESIKQLFDLEKSNNSELDKEKILIELDLI